LIAEVKVSRTIIRKAQTDFKFQRLKTALMVFLSANKITNSRMIFGIEKNAKHCPKRMDIGQELKVSFG